jgi:uncharacterized membrane protein (DUF441 family)
MADDVKRPVVILLTSGVILLAVEIMSKFNGGNIQFLQLTSNGPVWKFFFFTAIFIPSAVLFANVVSRSARWLRSFAPIPAILLFAAFMGGNAAAEYMAAPYGDLLMAAVAVVAFFGACWLYDNRYEAV